MTLLPIKNLFDQVCCLLWVDEEPWSSFTRGNSIETDTNTNHRWTEHHWTHYVKKQCARYLLLEIPNNLRSYVLWPGGRFWLLCGGGPGGNKWTNVQKKCWCLLPFPLFNKIKDIQNFVLISPPYSLPRVEETQCSGPTLGTCWTASPSMMLEKTCSLCRWSIFFN